MSLRGPIKLSHLRQVSAASSDTLYSRSTGISNNDKENDPPLPNEKNISSSSSGLNGPQCTIWVHDEAFSKEEILFNQATLGDVKTGDIIEIRPIRPSGDTARPKKPDLSKKPIQDIQADPGSNFRSGADSKFKTPVQTRCLYLVKPLPPEIKTRHPKLEISVTSSVANIFGFKNRTQVFISVVDRAQCAASHVDIAFRDQYMVRSDMWRLAMTELADKVVYKGQKLLFMGSIKATVKSIFSHGRKVLSGYFSPHTIPVFRSESAKYVLFIQMSREMWDFDCEGTGDILFSRVINGFLPELFKRWANIDAKHLVTIVLFTRVDYATSTIGGPSSFSSGGLRDSSNPNPYPTKDFYRVVVNDMASGHWTTILDELKKEFRTFLRDVSTIRPDEGGTPTLNGSEMHPKTHPITIAGRPSTALRGNILEAIHLASAHLAFDHIDRDMLHTGTSIIVITPGSGVFEVSYESLASTTEALTNRGIAIDLVCLSPMPLHSVPLFKYRQPTQKPSNSGFNDMYGGGQSPEMRQSYASFGSRMTSRVPRSVNGSISATEARDPLGLGLGEWSYGIPHWLDISYWNPHTYREARRLLKKDPNAPIPFTVTRQSKAFIPRLRMYEIQMMGVMESEQSNISIPYLSEEHRHSRAPSSAYQLSSSSYAPSKTSSKHNSPYSSNQLSDSLRPEPFLQNIPHSKGVTFSGSAKQQSILSWMDEYDDAVFKPFPKQRRKVSKSKRLSGPDVQVSGMHERISARSISRLRESENNPSNHGYSTRIIPRKADPRVAAPPVDARKSPIASKDAVSDKPAAKPPPASRASRISRTISFALRGLSATPPRAQASTELKVEHAEALPMSNQKTRSAYPDAKGVKSVSPSDTTPTSTVLDPSSRPTSPQKPAQESAMIPTRPISIKVPSKKPPEDTEQTQRPELPESFSSNATEIPLHESTRGAESQAKRPVSRFGMARSISFHDQPPRPSLNGTLSPWVRSINPCNTSRKALRDTSWFGRWQHAYPRPPHVAVVKWKSLKSPAILPLTTEEFPTADEFSSEYLQTPYRVSPNDDADGIEAPKTRGVLLREMVSLRLSHGFQIVVGRNVAEVTGYYALESLNVFHSGGLESDGTAFFLSKGNSIHRLVCVEDGEIGVTRFIHRNSSTLSSVNESYHSPYSPAMRTILSPVYETKHILLDSTMEEYNWNYADNYIAGHRDYLINPAQQLHFWRVRYVLIPMHLHAHSRRHLQSLNEDNEEEIHLLGIRQLTHIWQRHKYVPPEEKRFETGKKYLNPLNIMYQTRNQSEVVTAELDRILLTDPFLDNPPAQLLPESELLERSNVNISSLAHIIQGEKGVRMMDRRWHWRLHHNCFIGFEFTTWLVQTFRDIDRREEAVEFGNELMKHGLLQHVERRHNFRDGNYFYRICNEYRVARPESRGTWFPQKRSDRSAPTTPAGDSAKDSPAGSHSRSVSTEANVPPIPSTPSRSKNKVAIMLSKAMKYDVDPRKRSSRPEVIDLHYDRLHNPENCFHIELSWMNTTPKLIEDAVLSWASTAEKFGLKLVQVPVSEACSIDHTQPFRKPYRVKLKVPPPSRPVPPLGNVTTFSQTAAPDRLYYQKAILRKFDFVLDFEARSAFPADVEVSYSWGKPEYKYAQYIHRSGSLIAQLTNEGDFLVLANRLVSTRGTANRDTIRHDRPDHYRARANTYDPLDRTSPRLSPFSRPVPDSYSPSTPQVQPTLDSANLYRAPEHILSGLTEFCDDAAKLEQFYMQSHARPVSTKVAPSPAAVLDASIPSLELPASVVSHHISPPANVGPRMSYDSVMSSMDLRTRPINDGSRSPRSGSLRPLL